MNLRCEYRVFVMYNCWGYLQIITAVNSVVTLETPQHKNDEQNHQLHLLPKAAVVIAVAPCPVYTPQRSPRLQSKLISFRRWVNVGFLLTNHRIVSPLSVELVHASYGLLPAKLESWRYTNPERASRRSSIRRCCRGLRLLARHVKDDLTLSSRSPKCINSRTLHDCYLYPLLLSRLNHVAQDRIGSFAVR